MLLCKFCFWRQESIVAIALSKLSMNICGMERRKDWKASRQPWWYRRCWLSPTLPMECTCYVQGGAESVLTEGPSSSWTCSLHQIDSKDILSKLVLSLFFFFWSAYLMLIPHYEWSFYCRRPKGHFKTWIYAYFKIKWKDVCIICSHFQGLISILRDQKGIMQISWDLVSSHSP